MTVRHHAGEWRRLVDRAAVRGAGIETAVWNAAPGLVDGGYNLELVELGLRASDYARGVCPDCWRALSSAGVCVPGCGRVRSYVRRVPVGHA